MSAQRLGPLLQGFADAAAFGERCVQGLSLDSRAVRFGEAFVALRGMQRDGLEFIAQAAAQGANVVLAEGPPRAHPVSSLPVIWIERLGERLGEIAARFYGHPSRALKVIGVTGTNGKTSTVQLLAQALTALGRRAASIGTLGAGPAGALEAGERTTPDAIAVQARLAAFCAQGIETVAMEVSSHALSQGRVNAVEFAVAAFTNLSRDHLDYHGSMDAYAAAKAQLFAWPELGWAIFNIDDVLGRALAVAPSAAQRLRLSANGDPQAEVRAEAVVSDAAGLAFALHTPWGQGRVESPLLGRFNVANLLTVAACLGALGVDFAAIQRALAAVSPVPGRMNRLGGAPGQPLAVIDYAHTPDALEQALLALRAHSEGRLICVFGCGGERDAGKRPAMAAIAERLADCVVVTDDNPRGEDGAAIVREILTGFAHPQAVKVERDRAAAIDWALAAAKAEDVVLIAGKGHETYQETREGRQAFDDTAVAVAALEHYS